MKKIFDELKQEAETIIDGTLLYILKPNELSALLAAYDESKWKPYPKNVPEDGDYLVCVRGVLTARPYYQQRTFLGVWVGGFNQENIVAFQELPNPYNNE